jgi:hypothetical protein
MILIKKNATEPPDARSRKMRLNRRDAEIARARESRNSPTAGPNHERINSVSCYAPALLSLSFSLSELGVLGVLAVQIFSSIQ